MVGFVLILTPYVQSYNFVIFVGDINEQKRELFTDQSVFRTDLFENEIS
jgi:hypothetical protein